jgi:hypothetical protein
MSGSGGKNSHFRALMEAETWMNASEAASENLADEVVNPSLTSDAGNASRRTSNKSDWDKLIESFDAIYWPP